MNKTTRDKLYAIIIKRDREYCKCCGKLPYEGKLVLDHKDNDNTNNIHTNLQILCYSCNYLKNPRKEPLDLCVNEKESNLEESCLTKNKRTEPAFEEFILNEINNDSWGMIEWNEATNMGAQKIGISPITVERYLKKLITKYGSLRLRENSEGVKYIVRRHFEDTKNPKNEWDW